MAFIPNFLNLLTLATSSLLVILLTLAGTTLSVGATNISATLNDTRAFPLDPGFDIRSVAALAKALPSHSWETGTASEALLELYNPDISVFGRSPFPIPFVNTSDIPALVYAKQWLIINTKPSSPQGLSGGSGATGDPESIGVSAILIAKGDDNQTVADGVNKEVNYIMNIAPRFWNGAISQRSNIAALW
jgi:hypothetical protein